MSQTTQVTIFDQSAMPAHLVDLNTEGNIESRIPINQISFRGKTWRLIVDGKEQVINNAEGDPVQAVKVVVLDYNKKRSRALYPAYVEGKNQMPTCWSADGTAPDANVPAAQKQARSCAECKQSQKGSKISDAGKQLTACAQFKRAVLVPAQDLSFPPLLLKIPQTSMWDGDNKENEAKNFYAFDQLMDFLKVKGVNHTAAVVIKIKFDQRTAYPKLVFSAVDWTPAAAAEAIKAQLAKKDLITSMLSVIDIGVASPEAPAPEEFEQAAAPAAAAEAAAVVARAAAPTPAPAAAAPAAPAAPAAAKAPPKARPAPKPAAAPAPVAAAVDPDDAPVLAAAPAAAAPAAAEPVTIEGTATKVAEAPAGNLGALLTSWDED